LEMEILPERHRATLWPYRPKREPDELLSSWLWRIARGLGAPPRRFLFDTVGAHIADVDKEIDDAAIERLAFFSGQSPEHLLHGTMRADVRANPDDKQEKVQRLLLRHGELVLNRKQGGRVAPVTQYCPVCLAHPRTAYLRRGWRFSIESVCFRDSCFLLDSCWKCGALLDPLSQTVPSDEFVCCRCYAQLAKAPSISMVEAVLRTRLRVTRRSGELYRDTLVGRTAWHQSDQPRSSPSRTDDRSIAASRHSYRPGPGEPAKTQVAPETTDVAARRGVVAGHIEGAGYQLDRA